MTNYLTALDDLNQISDDMYKLKDIASELPDNIYYQFLDTYNELTIKLDQSIGLLERIRDRLQTRLAITSAYAACDSDGININKIQQTIDQLIDLTGIKED